jgi:hypothetical protein
MLAPINSTMTSIEANLVIQVRATFFEKLPKTYPIMNTILATNNILIKIRNAKGIVLNFR